MKINGHSISRLEAIDWDFTGNYSESAFSAVHWHPCRFVSQIPATVIGLMSEPGELVIDPFLGSGTTVVEAQRLGRRAVGIDLNPVSCLVSRAKTLPLSAEKVGQVLKQLAEDARDVLEDGLMRAGHTTEELVMPGAVQGSKWYTPRTLRDLGLLWTLIHSYRGTRRILGEASFSAILLRVCREVRHWGYICDNTTPKTNHQEDVLEEYCQILVNLREAYADRAIDVHERFGCESLLPEATIVCDDAREALARLPDGAADLVMTSPPYFGVSDYVKAQRLSLEWLGPEIEPLRLREIGARSKRHRVAALSEYLREVREVFGELARCLRKGGSCAVVIGESSARRPYIDSFRDGVLSCGFKLLLETERRVSAQRRQAPSILREKLLIMQVCK